MNPFAPSTVLVIETLNDQPTHELEAALHETEALAQLKRGDISGLEVVTRLYAARAVRAAYLVTRDPVLAEDVAQEAFVQAYTRIGQYDATRSFAPWFLRIVLNRATDAVKRRGRELGGAVEARDLADQLPDPSPGPMGLAEQSELRAEVWQALGRLSPKQRAVVVMRYYLDMSEEEMADRLAVPSGTIKSRLHTARLRLKTFLGPVFS